VWRIALLTAALAAVPAAQAFNLQFLQDSPDAYFTDPDWERERQAARSAVEAKADGESVAWENKATGNSGAITPLRSFAGKSGERCREARIARRAKKASGEAIYQFCQQPDGSWRIVTE
jgi:surface antigen